MQGHARISDDDPSASVTRQCPLSSNPELEIISRQVGDGWAREYRVDNFRTLVSGRVIRGDSTWGWVDILLISTAIWLAYVQPERLLEWDWTAHRGTLFKWIPHFPQVSIAAVFAFLCCARPRITTYQSVLTLPRLGIQLSTTRQLHIPLLSNWRTPFSTTKTFVPLADISTVVINEGLRRWSVRYYLAIIKRGGSGVLVAFDLVTPRHAVLQEVYHGIREELFDEWAAKTGRDSHVVVERIGKLALFASPTSRSAGAATA